jgi:hypothetical protein
MGAEVQAMTFTPNKGPYTLHGYPDAEVRIYAWDGAVEFPIHGAYKRNGDLGWTCCAWKKFGRHPYVCGEGALDLIDRPAPTVKVGRWSFACEIDGQIAVHCYAGEIGAKICHSENISAGYRVSAIQHHVYEVPSE